MQKPNTAGIGVRIGLDANPISNDHRRIGMRLDYYMTMDWDTSKLSQFSQSVGMTIPVLKRVAKGNRELTLSELRTIAEYFNTTPEKVLEAKF